MHTQIREKKRSHISLYPINHYCTFLQSSNKYEELVTWSEMLWLPWHDLQVTDSEMSEDNSEQQRNEKREEGEIKEQNKRGSHEIM